MEDQARTESNEQQQLANAQFQFMHHLLQWRHKNIGSGIIPSTAPFPDALTEKLAEINRYINPKQIKDIRELLDYLLQDRELSEEDRDFYSQLQILYGNEGVARALEGNWHQVNGILTMYNTTMLDIYRKKAGNGLASPIKAVKGTTNSSNYEIRHRQEDAPATSTLLTVGGTGQGLPGTWRTYWLVSDMVGRWQDFDRLKQTSELLEYNESANSAVDAEMTSRLTRCMDVIIARHKREEEERQLAEAKRQAEEQRKKNFILKILQGVKGAKVSDISATMNNKDTPLGVVVGAGALGLYGNIGVAEGEGERTSAIFAALGRDQSPEEQNHLFYELLTMEESAAVDRLYNSPEDRSKFFSYFVAGATPGNEWSGNWTTSQWNADTARLFEERRITTLMTMQSGILGQKPREGLADELELNYPGIDKRPKSKAELFYTLWTELDEEGRKGLDIGQLYIDTFSSRISSTPVVQFESHIRAYESVYNLSAAALSATQGRNTGAWNDSAQGMQVILQRDRAMIKEFGLEGTREEGFDAVLELMVNRYKAIQRAKQEEQERLERERLEAEERRKKEEEDRARLQKEAEERARLEKEEAERAARKRQEQIANLTRILEAIRDAGIDGRQAELVNSATRYGWLNQAESGEISTYLNLRLALGANDGLDVILTRIRRESREDLPTLARKLLIALEARTAGQEGVQVSEFDPLIEAVGIDLDTTPEGVASRFGQHVNDRFEAFYVDHLVTVARGAMGQRYSEDAIARIHSEAMAEHQGLRVNPLDVPQTGSKWELFLELYRRLQEQGAAAPTVDGDAPAVALSTGTPDPNQEQALASLFNGLLASKHYGEAIAGNVSSPEINTMLDVFGPRGISTDTIDDIIANMYRRLLQPQIDRALEEQRRQERVAAFRYMLESIQQHQYNQVNALNEFYHVCDDSSVSLVVYDTVEGGAINASNLKKALEELFKGNIDAAAAVLEEASRQSNASPEFREFFRVFGTEPNIDFTRFNSIITQLQEMLQRKQYLAQCDSILDKELSEYINADESIIREDKVRLLAFIKHNVGNPASIRQALEFLHSGKGNDPTMVSYTPADVAKLTTYLDPARLSPSVLAGFVNTGGKDLAQQIYRGMRFKHQCTYIDALLRGEVANKTFDIQSNPMAGGNGSKTYHFSLDAIIDVIVARVGGYEQFKNNFTLIAKELGWVGKKAISKQNQPKSSLLCLLVGYKNGDVTSYREGAPMLEAMRAAERGGSARSVTDIIFELFNDLNKLLVKYSMLSGFIIDDNERNAMARNGAGLPQEVLQVCGIGKWETKRSWPAGSVGKLLVPDTNSDYQNIAKKLRISTKRVATKKSQSLPSTDLRYMSLQDGPNGGYIITADGKTRSLNDHSTPRYSSRPPTAMQRYSRSGMRGASRAGARLVEADARLKSARGARRPDTRAGGQEFSPVRGPGKPGIAARGSGQPQRFHASPTLGSQARDRVVQGTYETNRKTSDIYDKITRDVEIQMERRAEIGKKAEIGGRSD